MWFRILFIELNEKVLFSTPSNPAFNFQADQRERGQQQQHYKLVGPDDERRGGGLRLARTAAAAALADAGGPGRDAGDHRTHAGRVLKKLEINRII